MQVCETRLIFDYKIYEFFKSNAGGRGVIDGIEKNLSLTPAHVAASRHALYTYVNYTLYRIL